MGENLIPDLIAKLEAAEGGSRELDWRIAELFSVPSQAAWPKQDLWPPFMVGSKIEKSIPAYTTSLDAIVALIGEKLPGEEWSVTQDENRSSAWIAGQRQWANTPPLALSVALLRALQQKEGKDG